MVADNGPLRPCRYSIKKLPFPATIAIYNINNVYTVFLINLNMIPSGINTFISNKALWTFRVAIFKNGNIIILKLMLPSTLYRSQKTEI